MKKYAAEDVTNTNTKKRVIGYLHKNKKKRSAKKLNVVIFVFPKTLRASRDKLSYVRAVGTKS